MVKRRRLDLSKQYLEFVPSLCINIGIEVIQFWLSNRLLLVIVLVLLIVLMLLLHLLLPPLSITIYYFQPIKGLGVFRSHSPYIMQCVLFSSASFNPNTYHRTFCRKLHYHFKNVAYPSMLVFFSSQSDLLTHEKKN